MARRFIFSSESVGEGHPDKVCDTISDAILDACLTQDKNSRVACETYAKSNLVIVGGEITIPKLKKEKQSLTCVLNIDKIVREAIEEIGYVNEDDVFHANKVFITNIITDQSADISQGVDQAAAEGKEHAEQGAGDQGLMFGFACDETPELMPAPIMFAHRLGRELTRIRKSGKCGWLRPDAKSQVSVIYEDNKPVGISNVVISTQHSADVKHSEIERFLHRGSDPQGFAETDMLNGTTEFLINPTGRFVVGGPQGDTGLTGRKIIVDSYGGMGPSRWRRVLRKRSEQSRSQRGLHGTLGREECCRRGSGAPLRSAVRLRHRLSRIPSAFTSTLSAPTPSTKSRSSKRSRHVFSFKPADIIQQLDLLRPIYSKTTNYGHFGKDDPDLTWEKTDKADG